MAGNSENTTIATVPSSAVASNSGMSMRMNDQPGTNRSTEAGIEARDRPSPIASSGIETISAISASSSPSIRVWVKIRARLAPSASRIAYSGDRSAPRAISRLAMLAQAINSSSRAAPCQMPMNAPAPGSAMPFVNDSRRA